MVECDVDDGSHILHLDNFHHLVFNVEGILKCSEQLCEGEGCPGRKVCRAELVGDFEVGAGEDLPGKGLDGCYEFRARHL